MNKIIDFLFVVINTIFFLPFYLFLIIFMPIFFYKNKDKIVDEFQFKELIGELEYKYITNRDAIKHFIIVAWLLLFLFITYNRTCQ